MMNRGFCMIVLLVTCTLFGQNYKKHKVKKGETVAQIALEYNVTPYDIYQLNPDAKNGIEKRTVLLIPNPTTQKKAAASSTLKHKVEPKETLFGIEKKYGITDEALKKANPFLEKEGLQIGQILMIPTVKSNQKPALYHEVLPKETKYSIAKKYDITIEELERRNPAIIPNLTIGYRLLIKGTPSKDDLSVKAMEPTVKYIDYEVKPKETFYSLTKTFGLSQDELMALNPILKDGVKDGMHIKVPARTSMAVVTPESKKTITTLSINADLENRKKLILLLPFNLTKIETDTVNSTSSRLKKDKFLNMTLDFYSGALMAIDSARTIGIPVDVKIFDSQETKSTSNIAGIVQENHLETADAIIGPFYQSNVEALVQLLDKNNVPVISPLSKDVGNPLPNLIQTIPNADTLKLAIFDYMRRKKGNLIAVVDKKKESTRQYLQQNQPDVKLAGLLENGNLAPESLKSLFVPNKINYVILETGNTVMIKTTIRTMLEAMSTYNVQLVVLETNETLDTDEIKFENLVKLKLMYPSINRENESAEALIFKKEYRIKNKVFPNTYATRGFDVTFDTMLRLSQGKTFKEMANTTTTQQVENKFSYSKKEDGGYTNKGVYILYYDSDLTIKEAQ